MDNLAIIPARAGSKGLKDKNIKLLNGKPLIEYSINAAIESNRFDEIMVSTDSNQYANIAVSCGAKVPFLRSKKNSLDMSSSWEVVLEVLSNYKNKGEVFRSICLLQPTSPLRMAVDINMAYEQLTGDIDSVTSVCEVDHSPLWTMKLGEDLLLNDYRKKNVDLPRQSLDKYYRENGAIYIRTIKYENNKVVLLNNKEKAFIMNKKRSIDIDDDLDFIVSELLMKAGGYFNVEYVLELTLEMRWAA